MKPRGDLPRAHSLWGGHTPGAVARDRTLPSSCQAPTLLVTGHSFLSLGLRFLIYKMELTSSASLGL